MKGRTDYSLEIRKLIVSMNDPEVALNAYVFAAVNCWPLTGDNPKHLGYQMRGKENPNKGHAILAFNTVPIDLSFVASRPAGATIPHDDPMRKITTRVIDEGFRSIAGKHAWGIRHHCESGAEIATQWLRLLGIPDELAHKDDWIAWGLQWASGLVEWKKPTPPQVLDIIDNVYG